MVRVFMPTAKVIFVLTILSLTTARSDDEPKKKSDSPVNDQINKLIDSMANANHAPMRTSVNVPGEATVIPGFTPGSYPIFADDYNWDEDRRVRGAAEALAKQDGEKLWWCLMAHADDKRYAITYQTNGALYIATIGVLCWQKAWRDLTELYDVLLPENVRRDLMPIHGSAELTKWYLAHMQVPLFKQQIELGQLVLERAQKLETTNSTESSPPKISHAEKTKVLRQLKERIETLQRTAQPTLSSSDIFANRFDDYHFFEPEIARQIREASLGSRKREETNRHR